MGLKILTPGRRDIRFGINPLLLALLLIGCSPGDQRIEPRQGAAPAEASAEAQDLTDLLTCRDPELFEESPERQAERLALWPGMDCRVEQQGGPYAECQVSDTLRIFGLPIRSVSVSQPEGEDFLVVDLDAEPAAVAEAAGRALGLPFRAHARSGSSLTHTFDADGRSYSIHALGRSWTSFGCSLGDPREDGALPPLEVPAGAALVSGSLSYPSEYIPAMRVCALDTDDPGRGYCTLTAIDDSTYRLVVPPGRWWLLAWPRDTGADGAPARYSEATACLAAGGSGCDDHRLRPVSIVAGEHRNDIDLLDWPDERTDPSPMEPRGEALPGRGDG